MRINYKNVAIVSAVIFALAAAHTSWAEDYQSINQDINVIKDHREDRLQTLVGTSALQLKKKLATYDKNMRYTKVYDALYDEDSNGYESINGKKAKSFYKIKTESATQINELLDSIETTYSYTVRMAIQQDFDLTSLIGKLLSSDKRNYFIEMVREEYRTSRGQIRKQDSKKDCGSSHEKNNLDSKSEPLRIAAANERSMNGNPVAPATPSPQASPRSPSGPAAPAKAWHNPPVKPATQVPADLSIGEAKTKFSASFGKYFDAITKLESFGFSSKSDDNVAAAKARRISAIEKQLVVQLNGLNNSKPGSSKLNAFGLLTRCDAELQRLFSASSADNKDLREISGWWQKLISWLFGYKSECEEVLAKISA